MADARHRADVLPPLHAAPLCAPYHSWSQAEFAVVNNRGEPIRMKGSLHFFARPGALFEKVTYRLHSILEKMNGSCHANQAHAAERAATIPSSNSPWSAAAKR